MARGFTQREEAWMRRALTLARRGEGRVEPNPMVGCVLVRADRMIAEGWHQRFGGPHAEVVALRRAGENARGATAYVTLEPCSHHGKTPPCTDALIAAGITRVVAAQRDPFPQVAGRGLSALRRAGIAVELGLLADAARELNAPYLTRVLHQRPYVILKWAQSIDGKIATRSGVSRWISGPESRRIVHRLRARVDAIAVGIRTVLRDDPLLTARDVPVRRKALRVVFDSRLRIPLTARLVGSAAQTPTLIFTTRAGARGTQRARLEARGVEIVCCRARQGQVDLDAALDELHTRGCTNLLVEGGGELIGRFVDARLADEAQVFTAPLIIGGRDAPSGCAGDGVLALKDALRSRYTRTRAGFAGELFTTLRLSDPPVIRKK